MSAATAESASLDDAQRIPASDCLLGSCLRHVALYVFMIEGAGRQAKVMQRTGENGEPEPRASVAMHPSSGGPLFFSDQLAIMCLATCA